MATIQAPDLTTKVPRSGREKVGGYAWLARLADKARAEDAGTGGEYTAYCPISIGWLEHVGVTPGAFEGRIRDGASDEELVTFMDGHVLPGRKEAGNCYVLEDMSSRLDEQDIAEGRG